jgi:hypothetical protein
VVEVASVDGATRIRAVGGGVALGNPTAATITHVLNNRREFPAAASIDDLLVMSIGTRAGEAGGRRAPEVASIAAEGVSDMVRNVRPVQLASNRGRSGVPSSRTAASNEFSCDAALRFHRTNALPRTNYD